MKTIELDDIFNTLDAWETAAWANEEAAQAARVERDMAWDELDKMAYDYNHLAVELCRTEDQLAEAASCVRLLIAFARARVWFHGGIPNGSKSDWSALPDWAKKRLTT